MQTLLKALSAHNSSDQVLKAIFYDTQLSKDQLPFEAVVIFQHDYQFRDFHLRATKDGKKRILFIMIPGSATSITEQHGIHILARLEKLPIYRWPAVIRSSIRHIDTLVEWPVLQDVFIYGLQDWHSWWLGKVFKARKRPITVVADNLEFFLREDFFDNSQFIKVLLKKAAITAIFGTSAASAYALGTRINPPLLPGVRTVMRTSLTRTHYSGHAVGSRKRGRLCFISQPYYLDFGLDFDRWIESLVALIHNLATMYEYEQVCFVQHQRDSSEFLVAFQSKINVRVVQSANLKRSDHIAGLFSTLLIENALSGHSVRSFFGKLEWLFPTWYRRYVHYIASTLDLDLSGRREWKSDIDLTQLWRSEDRLS